MMALKKRLLKGWPNSVKKLCKLRGKQDEEKTFYFYCLWVIPSVQA